nr:uncharacterized protein LOC127308846 [Lolium perenne]
MSSSPRRRHKRACVEEIHGAEGRTQQRLPELDAPSVDKGLRVSSAETKAQTCEDDDICQGAPNARQYLELDKLPEDMLHHIHSLLPLQDAARAACVSRGFLRSWRCYSNLILNWQTLRSTDDKFEGRETRYINKIDKILNNYSENGMKVKKLRIDLLWCISSIASYLDRWLQIAIKSGINELSFSLPTSMKEKYCFPYSVLFDETNTSPIESIYLFDCIFHPIETLGCFKRLKSLDLVYVHITEDGLQQLLSKSSGLERLQICSAIICLKIPFTLQKLKFLAVTRWYEMQAIEISAPNLSTFHYIGSPVEISIRYPSQLKDVYLASFVPSRILSYGRANLPFIARHVERLTLISCECQHSNAS